jgi:hypothetical protein
MKANTEKGTNFVREFLKVVFVLALLSATSCEELDQLIEKRDETGAAVEKKVTDPAQLPADETEPVEELPFTWGQVHWVSGDDSVGDWAITVNIAGASIGGSTVSWQYSIPPGNWAQTGRISGDPNACVGWVALIDGAWYGAIGEWLLPGMTWQTHHVFTSDRGNKRMFSSPLSDYEPTSGQVFYLFVCGLNWSGQHNVKERSNLVPVVFP